MHLEHVVPTYIHEQPSIQYTSLEATNAGSGCPDDEGQKTLQGFLAWKQDKPSTKPTVMLPCHIWKCMDATMSKTQLWYEKKIELLLLAYFNSLQIRPST
jgi:hypothetical protein